MYGNAKHALVVSALFLTAIASGQTNSFLRGTVTDPSNAAVPHATVTLTNTETGLGRSTETADDGVYQFPQVPPGAYKLDAQAPGFKSAQIESIRLLVGTPATADIILQVGTQAEQVTVSAEALHLNTDDATIGAAFQQEQVRQLPIESRNVVDLLSLQAGVVYTGNRPDINLNSDTRSGSVNGARSDQTSVQMDGVDVSDQANGYAFTSVLRTTPDSLQEFRVVTTNPTAGDGSSSGASVKLVTKGGTNAFHGSAYEFLRNTATSANDYFIKLAELKSGQPNKPPQLNRNLFGTSLGGPIKQNRAFFFVNYEGRRDAQAVSQVTTVPTALMRQGTVRYVSKAGPTVSVTPNDFKAWDPQGVGVNKVVLDYLNSFPMPNDNSVGDGLNFAGYRWAAPIHNRFDVYIARFDYQLDSAGKHNLFWRGSTQNDYQNGTPFLPGQAPQSTTEDRSKGFTLGYTAILKPSLLNEFRFGYTRASIASLGNSADQWVTLSGISNGVTRTATTILPDKNFVDNMTWTKGRHTLQFGADAQLITDQTYNTGNSFSTGGISTNWLNTIAFAGTNSPFDPANHGFPVVASSFGRSYDQPAVDVLGIVSSVTAHYNYDKNGNVLPQGAPITRNYALHQYDLYFQDSFRIKPNFTLNYGVRYQLETPPWETGGTQVTPTFDCSAAAVGPVNLGGVPCPQSFSDFERMRGAKMLQGITSASDPIIRFQLGGPANNGADFYQMAKLNFAPRLSIAYSPRPTSSWLKKIFGENKTSIRAGAGMAYDHFGTQIISAFDKRGAFGLSTNVQNPGTQTADCAPRLTSFNVIPTMGCNQLGNGGVIFSPAPAGGFPQTPPIGPPSGYVGGWTSDSSLRTPYTYMLNFSVARQIGSNSTFEAAYVGHLSHRLLSSADFGMPMNFVDPKSGVDFFSASSRLAVLANQGVPISQITNSVVGPTAAYWNDLYQTLGKNGNSTFGISCKQPGQCNALQAAYDMEQAFRHSELFEWWYWDPPGYVASCPNGCSDLGPYVQSNAQFYDIYGFSSLGNASYHALQLSFRHRFSRGVQFDINYTWSKSEDLSSDATRVANNSSSGVGSSIPILNMWDKSLNKAVSDYDMTHQLNANWVVELPFGKGKRFVTNARKPLDAVIGGWQLSGIYRITSGLPFSVGNGATYWPTSSSTGFATPNGTAPIVTGTVKAGDGSVLMFPDRLAAFAAYDNTLPGGIGSRNTLRGDGFLNLDSSLSKRWLMPYNENHSIQFRWEVFNVMNTTRFNVLSNRPIMTQINSFGKYTGLLTNPRVMQFALRYDF